MKKAKKTRRGPGFITTLVLIVLMAVIGVELVKMSGELKRKKAEQTIVSAQVQQTTWENEALKSALEKAGDEEFIKDLAREQGYIESNGRLFIDVHGTGD